jgi:hypothetical protein
VLVKTDNNLEEKMSYPFASRTQGSDAPTEEYFDGCFINKLTESNEPLTSEELVRLLQIPNGLRHLAEARGCTPLAFIHQGRHGCLTDSQTKCKGCGLTLDTGTRCPHDAGASADCSYKAKKLKEVGIIWDPEGKKRAPEVLKKKVRNRRSRRGSPNKP